MLRKRTHFNSLAKSNKNYKSYNFQAFANISGNIKFPENLQP